MAVDFSDLPKPSQTDFSDLPTPKAPSAPKASTASPEKPFEDRLKDIGGATAFGTAAGAFSPEIAFGAGQVLEKVPYAPVRAAGTAMKAAAPSMTGAKGRALGSLAGGFGGLTSETAGQAAELFGASPPVAESARIVGGLLPLEAVTSGTRGVGSLISMVKPGAGTAYNVMRSVMQDVGVANLAGKQRELVMQRIEELRKSPFTTDAQRKIYDTISDSVSKATNLAEAEANLARSTAGAQASGVRSTAQQVSKEEREKGVRLAATRGELEETKQTLLDRAKSGLREVGDATVELSQMGATLRDRILQRFETGSLERSEAYKQQKALRDQAVAAKESQGILVESLPEYKTLVQDLRNKLLKGQIAQQQKTAPVTEPGVLKAYQNIYDAVTARRVEVGVNEMGNPVYKTFPTSFDALDDVRRRLGDVAFGKDVEGYSAIGSNIAKEYYAKLSDIQSKFAGNAHDVLQKEYEIASRLLEKFRTKAGAKATAMDRIDPTQFKADAKSLPAALFNSQQSVADAIALTGDRNLVLQEAKNYVAKNLANMDAKAARNWLTSKQNSDWLTALPEVRTSANNYVMNLERAEGMAAGAGKVATRKEALERQAGREAGKALDIGEEEAGRLVKEGEKAAGAITDAARKEAATILSTAEPAARVQEIITSGDRTLWDRVAPAIAASPNGKQVLEQAIRQVMSDRAQQGVFGAQRFWQTSLKDSLARTGLMPTNKINEISQQLDAIANSALPEQQKLSLFGRTLKNLAVTYVAPQVGLTAYQALTGAGKPTSMQPGR
jgi:predicted secreted protein